MSVAIGSNDATLVLGGMEIAAWACDDVLWESFVSEQRRRQDIAAKRWQKRRWWLAGIGALATGCAGVAAGAMAAVAVGALAGVFAIGLPFAVAVGERRQLVMSSQVTFTSTGVVFGDRSRLYHDDSHRLSRAVFVPEEPTWILLEWTTLRGAPAARWEIPVPYGIRTDACEIVGLLAQKAATSAE